MKLSSTIINAFIIAALLVVGAGADGVRGVKKDQERDLQVGSGNAGVTCVYITGSDGVKRTVSPCTTPAPAPQVLAATEAGYSKSKSKGKSKGAGSFPISQAQATPGTPVGSTYPAPGSGNSGASVTVTSSSGTTTGSSSSVISSAQTAPTTGSGGSSPSDGFTSDQQGSPITPPQTQGMTSTPNLVELARSVPALSKFPSLLFAAGLTSTLQGSDEYTVFVPRNAALPSGVQFLTLQTDPNLRNLLLYHVVPGRILSSDLTNDMTATSVQGGELSVSINNGNVMINGANVVLADLVASNGVIHIIDQVLMPSGVALAQTVGSGLTPVNNPDTPVTPSNTNSGGGSGGGSGSNTGTTGNTPAREVCSDANLRCTVSSTVNPGVIVCRGGRTTCAVANSPLMMGDECGCCLGDIGCISSTQVARNP